MKRLELEVLRNPVSDQAKRALEMRPPAAFTKVPYLGSVSRPRDNAKLIIYDQANSDLGRAMITISLLV